MAGGGGVVGEIETLQVRSGDVILLRPREALSDARIAQVSEQLRSWLEFRRIKVHVALLPHDCDVILLREDRAP